MEAQSILALAMFAILIQGNKADLFHKVSDDPLEQWSLSVYRTIPVKETTSFMQQCAICKSDASCSGFTLNDLNLLLFDLKGNSSSSLLPGVYINLDRLFANHYVMFESNVDWNPNVFSSMKDTSCGLTVKSQPLSEMGCLAKCYFQLGQICQFFFVVDSVCYFGNLDHATGNGAMNSTGHEAMNSTGHEVMNFTGHEAMIQYTEPLKIFLRPDLVNITDYILKDNQPKATFASKIFAVADLSFGIHACKYYCHLFYEDPCDFYVIFDNKCWLGNQSNPTNNNLGNNLPDTISVYLPPGWLPPLNKLLVTTGSPTSTSVKTESFNLVASVTCQSMPDYPLAVWHAFGAFVNHRVVICGGYAPHISQCYSLGSKETAWKLNGNLITARYGAASAEINDKLLIFGGSGTTGYLQSTEELDVEAGTATQGPNMPLGIVYPCGVKINNSTVMIIGGYDGIARKSTYFYNYNGKTFTAGPDLIAARMWLACGILSNGIGSYVVVAGGYNGAYLDATEYLDLNDTTIWKTGPVLPVKMYGLTIAQHRNEVIVSGGYSNDGSEYQKAIYKLNCVTQGCAWQIMTTELSVPRREHVSVVVPDDFVDCP